MLNKKLALVALAGVLFTGCATTGTSTQTAKPAPQKTVGDVAETVHQGSSAVQSAVGAIHSIKTIFKK